LSPECLDGALHLMKPDCISIPESYSSFIGPVHSPRLLNKVQSKGKHSPREGYENAYVVLHENYFVIDSEKQLFKFEHPNFAGLTNDRYKELDFIARETSEMIGFLGYFTADLFYNIGLSTLPKTETPGLFSWGPVFFPIQQTVLVKKDERICLHFWRCSDKERVWYEWQLVEPLCLPICNINGRTYAMRLY